MPDEIKSRVLAGEPITVEIIYPSGVAGNVLKHGTGALNIDAGRVAANWANDPNNRGLGYGFTADGYDKKAAFANSEARTQYDETKGRWPANCVHDGSPEVMAAFARFGSDKGDHGTPNGDQPHAKTVNVYGAFDTVGGPPRPKSSGTAARFFKTCEFEPDELRFHFGPKAGRDERVGDHPTVKPVALMEWLVRLVTPPGGRVLDPFAGTGSTLVACDRLGFDAIGIDQDAQTVADAHEKIRRMRARRVIGEAAPREPDDPRQGALL